MVRKEPIRFALKLFLPFFIILTLLFAFLIIWENSNLTREQTAELRETADALFDHIILTRIWNAEHGGVYVEIDDKTLPNPYLDDPDRDIISINGKRYTKLNPAYMTRQLAELSNRRFGHKFRIISTTPLNPSNVPIDEWERLALASLEQGADRQDGITAPAGERFFRYVAPLRVEEPCLRCHARQGYEVGSVKGAVSITIPMRESDLLHQEKIRRHIFAFIGIGIITAVFMGGVTWVLTKQIGRSIVKEIEHRRLLAAIELSGAAAHEIRQPLTIIMGFSEMLQDKLSRGEPVTMEIEVIVEQCRRINEIISKMLGMTEYRTKPYDRGTEIFDFGIDPKKYEGGHEK